VRGIGHSKPPIDCPIEILVGTIFLYSLLGVSCLFGLLVTCLFLPLNHFAGIVIVNAQDNLMKARDERVSLMNEILGGIRMLKFMAWERSFEARVHKVRRKELKYQKRNYYIEVNLCPESSMGLVCSLSFLGAFQRHLERLPHLCHSRFLLALYCCSWPNSYPFDCFHISKSPVFPREAEAHAI